MNAALRDHFAAQAAACERLGSPFTAWLCRHFAARLDAASEPGRRVLAWPRDPGADALALRLCGALHALVLAGADAELAAVYPPREASEAARGAAIDHALLRHGERIAAFLDSPPQTNEVARATMLLPGLLHVARLTGRPLHLCEIGASAGLNLNLDRFFYAYGAKSWGEAGSAVQLAPEVRGAPPPLDGGLDITGRAACDRAPVDLDDAAARLRLTAYVWPDQPARLQRLDAAIGIARRAGTRVEAEDAASFVRGELASRPANAAFVLFHSIMWQYMPVATQAAISDALAEAGSKASAPAPVAHLRMEPLEGATGHATLSLTLWPGGVTRHLARCDFHGRWIEWTGEGS